MKRLALIMALAPVPAWAQNVNCSDPQTQTEMTYCAGLMAEAADEDLNLAYRFAIAAAKELDSYQPGLDPTNEELMRQAQRAWIPFRDAACTAEATLARGGTMANMLYLSCIERLTRQRTEDLRYYGEAN